MKTLKIQLSESAQLPKVGEVVGVPELPGQALTVKSVDARGRTISVSRIFRPLSQLFRG